jgi:membrane fusion protein, multidrug efflux system
MRKSYFWAAAITIGLTAWMASPYYMPKLMGEAAPAPEEAKTEEVKAEAAVPFKVRVRKYTASMRSAEVSARGITDASRRVEARARTEGVIVEQNFAEGQSVKAGDVLCKLDMGARQTQLAQAKAALASAERDYGATQKLSKRNYATDAQLFSQRASVDAAKTAVEQLEWDISWLDIKSTVDGVLVEKPAEAGSLLSPGGLCGTVSVLDPVIVATQVSERYIPYLHEGMTAKAKLATGQSVEGKVRNIGKSADLATRTFKVELEVANPNGQIRAGVTADLAVGLPPLPAHKLPASVLGLDDAGEFGVRLLNSDNTTKFMPVQMIAQETDGMWVGGLPAEITVVTTGQDFVRDGEKVEPVVETAEAKP